MTQARELAKFRETLALHKANRNGPGLYASDKVFALADALDSELARADRAEAELERVRREAEAYEATLDRLAATKEPPQ